jgi:hypothetical protein
LKNPLLNFQQACAHIGLPEGFMRNQLKRGNGPICKQPGGRLRFFVEKDLDDWMASWTTSKDAKNDRD